MRPSHTLQAQLQALDGQDYGAYQSLIRSYRYDHFSLAIEHIPKDPYAPPTTGVYRASVSLEQAGFPADILSSELRRTGLCDYVTRQFFKQCQRVSQGQRGTGNSGLITIAEPQQAILERTSVRIINDTIEARFFVGLPAKGRQIKASLAQTMLLEEVPTIVEPALYYKHYDPEALVQHLACLEDTVSLREQLHELGLIAFIADGACLPRASGVDSRPLETSEVVPFESPKRLQVRVKVPNAGEITGMGIPPGVTLIVGGGYHGKSTLLHALEMGVYNHIIGDGRELCVSLPEAVKVRASSGRYVINTDISAFISTLPFAKATQSFSTLNASGSTSQAASIAEALEVGAKVLLMDEDTCAANFMIRDKRMQTLVSKTDEPITAFIDKVQPLYRDRGVSTVLVMGGSGDYFDVADTVIHMKSFQPLDVTAKALNIALTLPTGRHSEGGTHYQAPLPRLPLADSINPTNQYGKLRVSAPTPYELFFGRVSVNLSDVEQLIEAAQSKAIGLAIVYAKKYMDGQHSLHEIAEQVMCDLAREGLDLIDPKHIGDLVSFRRFEFAAILNRLRGVKVKQTITHQ